MKPIDAFINESIERFREPDISKYHPVNETAWDMSRDDFEIFLASEISAAMGMVRDVIEAKTLSFDIFDDATDREKEMLHYGASGAKRQIISLIDPSPDGGK